MTAPIDREDVIARFKEAMRRCNIIPPAELEADGKSHRADVAGDGNGREDASYWLHLNAAPFGGFRNFKNDQGSDYWSYFAEVGKGRMMTVRSLADTATRRKARRAERHLQRERARAEVESLWSRSPECSSHPYLGLKNVSSHGLRVCPDARVIAGMDCQGALMVPGRDIDGRLMTLQFIDKTGQKRFFPRAPKDGAFHLIGNLKADRPVLGVAEGYATAATIHAASGFPVAVAFDAGNLVAVATALAGRYPDCRRFIAGDDDRQRDPNVGRTRAQQAAAAARATAIFPVFGDDDTGTDFNDMAQSASLDAVSAIIDEALRRGAPMAATGEHAPAAGHGSFQPTVRVPIGTGECVATDSGIYYRVDDSELWLCSPLQVLALTRDEGSRNWGRLLQWQDNDGVVHRWAMPMEALQGDGNEVWRELARLGVSISTSPKARTLLSNFLQNPAVTQRARCVERMGWHGSVYVTATDAIGQSDEQIVFQSTHALVPATCSAGSVDDWVREVAALAVGNSRLVLALSMAFAAPLLQLLNEESGAIHLRGPSSCGKTTIIRAAASVYGPPNKYVRQWRATTNGLEGLAALHNDGLLILDELSQIDPKAAGEAAYLLANGQGKIRASRTGAARPPVSWHVLVLSAGEESVADLMAKAGVKANAGQEIRLADIDADAGAGLGAFEVLHGWPSAEAFALGLRDASTRHYGAVGRAWLEKLVADRVQLLKRLLGDIDQFVDSVVPHGAEGQARRVARRFGLIAGAGTQATRYGYTGWGVDEAVHAARAGFASWLASHGSGNQEEQRLFAQVRAFVQAYGDSRFDDLKGTERRGALSRAGFYRSDDDGHRAYWVLSEIFRNEVIRGFPEQWAKAKLVGAGWLQMHGDRYSYKPKISGVGRPRVYVLTHRVLGD